MNTRLRPTRSAVLSVCALLVCAAASFYAMDFFERTVFDRSRPFQLSFALLAVSLCFAFLCKKSAVTLAVCAAAAAGMWFYTPVYAAWLFPVLLQAVLYDTAKNRQPGDANVYAAGILIWVAEIGLWVFSIIKEAQQNAIGAPAKRHVDRLLCLVLLAVLTLFYLWLGIRLLRARQALKQGKPAPSGKNDAAKKKQPRLSPAKRKTEKAAMKRGALVYFICVVNSLAQMTCSILFLTTDYCKVFFFSQLLFLFYLECRREPLLRLHALADKLLDEALTPPTDD